MFSIAILIEDLFTGSYLFRLFSDRTAILLPNKNIAQPIAGRAGRTASSAPVVQPKNIELL
jgi:hypothetical protein